MPLFDYNFITYIHAFPVVCSERTVITKHIKNIFKEGELEEESKVQNLHFTNSYKSAKYYSLDVIISVGYRVKSLRGTQFRIWVTKRLNEYIVKGFKTSYLK